MKIGDPVECKHDVEWQTLHQSRDAKKAEHLGCRFFMGNGAAYMHLDEAYVVEGVTDNGGLKLRGFAPTVSPTDVQPSTKPIRR